MTNSSGSKCCTEPCRGLKCGRSRRNESKATTAATHVGTPEGDARLADQLMLLVARLFGVSSHQSRHQPVALTLGASEPHACGGACGRPGAGGCPCRKKHGRPRPAVGQSLEVSL